MTGPLLLRDGARIRIGDQELTVERRRDTAEAGKTIVVRPGASLVASAVTPTGVVGQATQFGMRPRVRSGYALKQLDASEGSRRWVLRDLESNSFLRLSDNDAQLFRLLDGSRSLVELVGEAERRFGPTGAARLARLLADLGERGLMSGVAASNRADGGAGELLAQAGHAAREALPRARALVRRGLPPRRLGAVHAAGAVADRRALRGRRRRVRGADRAALRDAVRGREQDRDRRARVPARALPRRGACTRPRTGS